MDKLRFSNTNLPVVDFHRVHLKYDDGPFVLKNIQFSLERGSFHFVTGESGAGKTSLLRLMYLDQTATSGRIQMFGQDISQVKPRHLYLLRRRISVVFQDYRLLDYLNAYDNVALPLRIFGMKEKDIKKRVEELLGESRPDVHERQGPHHPGPPDEKGRLLPLQILVERCR